MLAPYALLIVPEAIANHNPRLFFILKLVGLALAGSATIETIMLRAHSTSRRAPLESPLARHNRTYVFTRAVILISVGSDVVNAAFGGGTVFTQLTGAAAASPVVSLTALLASWKFVAVGLLISCIRQGAAAKISFLGWSLALVGGQVVVAAYTARTQPLIAFISFVVFAGLMFSLLRARFVLAIAIIVLVAWPTIFTIRNQIREANGVDVSASVTAEDRLRFDLQVARAADYVVPVDVPGTPGFVDVLRYGIVPRIVDQGRPLLSTGTRINAYLGGTTTSSYTFLPLGTIYFLDGPLGVAVYYAAFAVLFVLLIKTPYGPGPIRISLLCLAIAGPLGWTNTYPDSLIGFLQSIVSATPVLIAVRLLSRQSRLADNRILPCRPMTMTTVDQTASG